MTSVQQDILMKLIEDYANLHRLKAMADDDQYSWEWQQGIKEEVAREMPIVKGKIEKLIKGLL